MLIISFYLTCLRGLKNPLHCSHGGDVPVLMALAGVSITHNWGQKSALSLLSEERMSTVFNIRKR